MSDTTGSVVDEGRASDHPLTTEQIRLHAAAGTNLPTRVTPAGVILTRIGIVVAFAVAALYLLAGSLWSAAAFGIVPLTLSAIHLFVPGEVPLRTVTHVMSAACWIATLVIAFRTGGLDSPMVMWGFFPPISVYLLCGRRDAIVWTAMAAVQIICIAIGESLGGIVQNDLASRPAQLHRAAIMVICVLSIVLVVLGGESLRDTELAYVEAANRVFERQRLLGDMHDGVGGQLLGLMLDVRSDRLDRARLDAGLQSCLDDLKLIVDSLDPVERSLALALAELRARVGPRFESIGIALAWEVDDDLPEIEPGLALHVLRAVQELTTNCLRHSGASTVTVAVSRSRGGAWLIEVADNGSGFDPAALDRVGRGLASLHSRAARLGGRFTVDSRPGSTVARIAFSGGHRPG